MSDPGVNRFSSDPPGQGGGGISQLLSELVRDLAGLVRGESRLMRAELAEAAKGMAAGFEQMAAGAILLLIAALILFQALIIVLARSIGPDWAAAVVGGVLALLGVVLFIRGRRNVAATKLMPDRTIEQTSRDVRLAREQL